ncbi:hypothetical protein C7M84_025487 [Penaeus vannamei]|uniref:Reverse transcriptase domain-containing protein n=1 Tax=Penaeus vannamei TaxID=6689 RepID=A0A3R7MGU0_PENVA|nr:hypothetical protein C7M84_025487 [Penaeus vannamei]
MGPCPGSLAPRDNVTPLKNNLTTINKLAAKVTEAIFGLLIQAEAASSDTHWNNLRKAVYSAAKETLGHPQRHHQDWFEDYDEEIHNLLAEVRQCRRVLSGQATRQATNKLKAAKAQLQTAISKMKNNWWLEKAAELQDYADAGNSKAFFDGSKAVYGPRQSGSLFSSKPTGKLAFRDATIIKLFKRNGDRRDCGNHRGISLLSIAGKILAKVVLMRLHKIFEDVLPESQFGFRRGRGTVDMIFAFRQLQEKAMEQNMPLYAVFVDFTKAFDTVDRDALWRVLAKYGCPPKLLAIIKAFHIGMKATFSISGNNSDAFEVLHGVKQGCVLAPTLFALYLAAILENMPSNLNKGIFIRTRMDADDFALVAHSLEDIQEILDAFAKSSAEFGLTINAQKTKILYQPPPGQPHVPTNVLLNRTPLNDVTMFRYLGSMMTVVTT